MVCIIFDSRSARSLSIVAPESKSLEIGILEVAFFMAPITTEGLLNQHGSVGIWQGSPPLLYGISEGASDKAPFNQDSALEYDGWWFIRRKMDGARPSSA
mmetsp:Transcript_93309/g.165920  ORF Transcript_93309/g.165920 Transcript_93309/m.165920 type:complete len:100 (+) Transcript_93309:16-315(+)